MSELPEMPSLAQRAKNLGATLIDVATDALHGRPILAPDAMVVNRMAICKGCRYFDTRSFCRSCGCITAAKVKLAASHCPEGKWRAL